MLVGKTEKTIRTLIENSSEPDAVRDGRRVKIREGHLLSHYPKAMVPQAGQESEIEHLKEEVIWLRQMLQTASETLHFKEKNEFYRNKGGGNETGA